MTDHKIKIDPEFKSLIPPLAPEELQQLEANCLGFEGFRDEPLGFLSLMPSTMGNYYWLWVHRDMTQETFSPKPVALSRLPLSRWRGFELKPVSMEPTYDYPPPAISQPPQLTNIYFIQSVIGGPVKIGKADFPKDRLATFQIGSPFELRIVKLLADVAASEEIKLHRRFAAYRLHGEWFSEKVLDLI